MRNKTIPLLLLAFGLLTSPRTALAQESETTQTETQEGEQDTTQGPPPARRFTEEVEVVAEDAAVRGEYRGFVRWARFDKHDGLIEVQWILRPDDTIAGLFVRPAKPKDEGEGAAAE